MTTIRDIADALDISSATVSRALNDDPRISDRTKDLVVAKAEELHYAASTSATKARRSKNTIGIIASEIVSANLSTLANAIIVSLKSKGYIGILGVTNFDKEAERNWLDTFHKMGVSGIIVLMYNDEEAIESLKEFRAKSSIPVMQINNFEEYSEYDSLMVSNKLAAVKIADHLQELGHKDVAILTDIQAQQRAHEIQKRLERNGMTVRKSSFVTIDDARYETAGYEAMKILYAKGNLPTAIVATYDYLAFGVMRFCNEKGISIPKDISLISIDNVATSAFTGKALTTVAIPTEDAGRIAARIMTDRVIAGRNKTAIQHITLNPELIIRETTAKPSR